MGTYLYRSAGAPSGGTMCQVSFQQRQYLEGASRQVTEDFCLRRTGGEFVNRAPRSGIADFRTVRTGQVPGFDGCKGEKYQLQKSGARATRFLRPHSSRQVRNRPSRKVEHEYSDMAFCTAVSVRKLISDRSSTPEGAIQVPGPGTRLLGREFILACPSPSAGWTLIVDYPCTIGGRSIGVIPDQIRPALFLDLTAPDRDRASMDLPQFAYVVAPVINSPDGPRIGNPNCGNQQAATVPRSGLGSSPPTSRRNSKNGRCIHPPQPGSWT
ncbi:hypothetical protein ASPFODRAFT_55278 [Aspergillus luchuensis CBS 106.47]|uniref:Uncharacterized protein n=1 Tax=Aspergillus luchuensis (strain CBS 106.47) TaxID=1137211 RepID=A0A1M3TXV9_ASPLC|nr:hypothetical protein ASPFODRAFT_55278 [Aspergillus luchuensis CBS 106.47]